MLQDSQGYPRRYQGRRTSVKLQGDSFPDHHSDCGGHFVAAAAPDSLVYCLDLGILSPDLLLCPIRVKRQFIPDTAQGMVQPTVKMASQIN